MELEIFTEIAAGMHSEIYSTSDHKMVFVKSDEYLKYDMIQTYSRIHNVDFKLSERFVEEEDGEAISFYMKRLYQRDFTNREKAEIRWICALSEREGDFEKLREAVRENVKSQIGEAFVKSMDMVIEFTNSFHHGYTQLDFHCDQILFDENGECIILDMLC